MPSYVPCPQGCKAAAQEVKKTRNVRGGIRRVRKCKACGTRFRTLEIPLRKAA
jgi:transcriptional regulator NrdR family protein